MKIISPLLLLIIFFSACKKEIQNATPVIPIMEMPDTTAANLKAGSFVSGPYGNVSGNAKIYRLNGGAYQVQLQNFNSSNGPDLYVYLSKEIMPVNFIPLGRLRSTNGDQLYDIPGMPSLTEYRYINIHCQQYNHLFGYALLQ
jgi:hypothetical protein